MRTFDKVMRLLEARGVEQQWLAARLGVQKSRITNWKNGVGEPTGSQLLQIARELGTSIEYLADPALDAPPPPPITADQRYILDVVHDLNITRSETVRRLSTPILSRVATPSTVERTPPKPAANPGRSTKRKANRD
jgi:transcriptional regulator with XRE-family HTH domain